MSGGYQAGGHSPLPQIPYLHRLGRGCLQHRVATTTTTACHEAGISSAANPHRRAHPPHRPSPLVRAACRGAPAGHQRGGVDAPQGLHSAPDSRGRCVLRQRLWLQHPAPWHARNDHREPQVGFGWVRAWHGYGLACMRTGRAASCMHYPMTFPCIHTVPSLAGKLTQDQRNGC